MKSILSDCAEEFFVEISDGRLLQEGLKVYWNFTLVFRIWLDEWHMTFQPTQNRLIVSGHVFRDGFHVSALVVKFKVVSKMNLKSEVVKRPLLNEWKYQDSQLRMENWAVCAENDL